MKMSTECDHVECLPSNVIPISKPSKILENLTKKRQKQHEAHLKWIRDEMRRIDIGLEKELHLESEITKDSLNRFKATMFELVEQTENLCTISQEPDFQVFDKATEKLVETNRKSKEVVDVFYNFLQGIERKRKLFYVEVLKEGFQRIHKMHYKVPNETIQYFQEETIRLNEITLTNHRAYSELVTCLRLQLEEYVRIVSNKLIENREKYKMDLKKLKVRELIEAKRSQPIEILETTCKSSTMRNVPCFDTEIDFNSDEIEKWTRQINDTLTALENGAKKLVSVYKMAMVKVFNRFFDDLQNITSYFNEDSTNETTDLRSCDSDVYKPVVEDIAQQYACQIADLQKLWNSITQYMQLNLKQTYGFLHRSSHLWDDHFQRIDQAQNLILRELKVAIEKNDRASRKEEVHLNKIVDQMRQASSVNNLDKLVPSLKKLLGVMEKSYQKHCEVEIKIVDKYCDFIDREIELLLAEIERFLKQHEKDRIIADQRQLRPSMQSIKDEENLIPLQMKACRFQVEAVNNWMFGLWETIKTYMATCKEELLAHAVKWVEDHREKLKNRLDVKLAIHKPRYMRIITGIYDVRKIELEEHLRMFKDLEEEIAKNINEEKIRKTREDSTRELILDDYEKQLEKIEDKMQQSIKSLQIQVCISNTEEITRKFRQQLVQIHDEFTANHEEITKSNDQAVYNFIAKLKLFLEGGNFSNAELKAFTKKTKKLQKSSSKKTNPVLGDSKFSTEKCIARLETMKSSLDSKLSKSKQEFQFKEKACAEIESLKKWIRNQVYEVKFQLRRAESLAEYFVELVEKGKDNVQVLQSLNSAVADICTLLKYLMNGDSISYANMESSHKFLNESTEGGRFLAAMNARIIKSQARLVEMGKSFYTSNGTIINTGKLQPDLGSFTNEVKEYYDDFRKQIQVCWMKCIQDVMELILDLITFIDYFQQKNPNTVLDLGDNIDILEHLMG